MRKLLTYGSLILSLLAAKPAFAQKGSSLTYYLYDTRNYHGVNFDGYNNDIPFGLNLSGFADITSKIGESDLSKFYLEPRLVRTGFFKKGNDLVNRVLNSFRAIAEYNGAEKNSDDNLRFGLASNNKIKGMIVNFKYLPLNTKEGQQLAVFFKKDNGRLYISGFFDYNIVKGRGKIVSEVQVGINIADKLYGVIENRINQFIKEKHGVSVGIEYKF